MAEELAAAGVTAHLGEAAETAFARGPRKRAKTDRAGTRLLRDLLAGGRLPECWIPPGHILGCRALLELCHDLRTGHTAQAQPRDLVPPGCPAAVRAGPERRAGRAARGRRRAPVAGATRITRVLSDLALLTLKIDRPGVVALGYRRQLVGCLLGPTFAGARSVT